MGGGWVYLDYRVSSGPFLRFSMRFELLSKILYHSVCEIRDPSLTIDRNFEINFDLIFLIISRENSHHVNTTILDDKDLHRIF